MKQRILIAFFVLIGLNGLQAQNLKKAFKQLDKENFEKAAEQFDEALKLLPHNPACLYGLAASLGVPGHPEPDYFRAFACLSLALQNKDSIDAETLEDVMDYYTSSKIEPKRDEVDDNLYAWLKEKNKLKLLRQFADSCTSSKNYEAVMRLVYDKEWQNAKYENTAFSYAAFIMNYPKAPQVAESKLKRNEMAWKDAETQNTLRSYTIFISRYPDASQVEEAKKKRDYFAFKKAQEENTLKAWVSYVKKYPEARQIAMAIENRDRMAFEDAIQKNTLEAYNDFLTLYPNSKQADSIFSLKSLTAYRLVKKTNTAKAYNQFLKEYTTSVHRAEITQLRNTAAFNEAKQINTVADYKQFLLDYPAAKEANEARMLCAKKALEEAKATNTILAYKQFLLQYSKSNFKKAATQYLHELAFEQAKTKNTIGAYKTFIRSYGNAVQVPQAIELRDKLAFDLAVADGSVEALEVFMKKYRKSKYFKEAQVLIEEILYKPVKEKNTAEAYNDYLNKFPDGKYAADAFKRKMQLLGSAFALKQKSALSNASFWCFDNDFRVDKISDMAFTKDSAIVMVGWSKSKRIWCGDAWIIKLGLDGSLRWQKNLGAVIDDAFRAVTISENNDIITVGYTESRSVQEGKIWIKKFSDKGEALLDTTCEGTRATDITATATNGFGLTGFTETGDGHKDFWVANFDANGAELWRKVFVKKGFPHTLLRTGDNKLLAAGVNFWCIVDMQGAAVLEKDLDETTACQAAALSQSGAVVMAGSQYFFKNESKGDFWVSSFSMDGTKQWEQTFDRTKGFETALDITVNGQDVIVAGATADPSAKDDDIWLLKLSATGNKVKEQLIGTKLFEKNVCLGYSHINNKLHVAYSSGINSDFVLTPIEF